MDKTLSGSEIRYQTIRLNIPIRESYDEFRRRFEIAVPLFDTDRAVELVERKASWEEVVADAEASAPHHFLLYWKLDLTPIMSLAGNTRQATEYLIGNHVIAETMYRHDPAVALNVPLRCAIYEANGGIRFAIEQPSTALSGLRNEKITQVGIDLDRKLADLLKSLSVDVPEVLLKASNASEPRCGADAEEVL